VSFLNGLFQRRRPEASADLAKQRLLTVLVDDRYKLTPDMLEQMKADLAQVLLRYLPTIDPAHIEVSVERGDGTDSLKADIPLRRTITD
jgi:cell division topological specificity factor